MIVGGEGIGVALDGPAAIVEGGAQESALFKLFDGGSGGVADAGLRGFEHKRLRQNGAAAQAKRGEGAVETRTKATLTPADIGTMQADATGAGVRGKPAGR